MGKSPIGGKDKINMSTPTRKTIEAALAACETSGEISERTGFAGPTVSNWPKRYEDFPAPVGKKGNATLFVRSEVDAWLASVGVVVEAPKPAPAKSKKASSKKSTTKAATPAPSESSAPELAGVAS